MNYLGSHSTGKDLFCGQIEGCIKGTCHEVPHYHLYLKQRIVTSQTHYLIEQEIYKRI